MGWRYDDGCEVTTVGRSFFECYPYTTLVGVEELGYHVERPTYKRKPKAVPTAAWRGLRAESCDDLIRRLLTLTAADPPLDLRSHPATARLADEASPVSDADYKHREDLLDAVICAWTASFWFRHGRDRCQVLGGTDAPQEGMVATIIAPMR